MVEPRLNRCRWVEKLPGLSGWIPHDMRIDDAHSRHCQIVCKGPGIPSLAAKAGVTKRRVTGGTIMAMRRFCLLRPHWRSSNGRRGLAGWTDRTTSRVRGQ